MSVSTARPGGARGFAGARFAGLFWSIIGLAVLLLAWWLGGRIIQPDPDLFVFAEFATEPTLLALYAIVANGEAWTMLLPSLWRVGAGLGFAAVIGVPVGIAIGRMPGWIVQCLEQQRGNILIRPLTLNNGPEARDYVPLAARP